jgi:peptide/nickel transport system substrate-binding protein
MRSAEEPPTLDPYVNAAVSTKTFSSYVYSRLFKIDTQPDVDPFDLLPVPDAAESAETEDGQHWVVKLRQGIKFHDIAPVSGREMTTEDVMFSYGRLTADSAPNRTQFSEVIDVQAVDDYTLNFTTASPSPTFLETIADQNLLVIQPREAGDGFDPQITPIGSGPFMQTFRQVDVKALYERHPNYFLEGFPYVDGIEETVIPEYANMKAQFQAGNLDSAAITADDILDLRAENPDFQWQRTAGIGMAWITFSGADMDPDAPWRDERFRRAVSMSLDRGILNELAGNTSVLREAGLEATDRWNNAQPATFGPRYWLDPQSAAQGESAAYFQFNQEEAHKLYDAMGVGADTYPYQYTGRYGSAFVRLAEAQGQMLAEGGLQMAHEEQDYAAKYITQTFLGNFHGIVYGLESSLTPGAYVERLFGADPANHARISDPTITALHEKQRVELDPEQRTAYLYDIQRRNADQMFYVPTQSSSNAGFNGFQPHMRGLRRTRGYGYGTESVMHYWMDV